MSESLNRAITSYQDWQSPWRFHDDVLGALAEGGDRERFEMIWAEALDEKHWTSSDLAEGVRHLQAVLVDRFADMSLEAAAAVAKAAAYEWR
jgi:hypothetical protein